MTLKERISKARELRNAGYNCATSVAACFHDITGLDEQTMIRTTNALGSGVAGTKEICGAVVGMAIANGFRFSPEAAAKAQASKSTNDLIKKFADSNDGCLRCSQLKDKQAHGGCVRSCNQLVEQCVEILHNSLPENE